MAVAALLIATVIALGYLPSLHASFQFDDWNVVVAQPSVQSVPAWWAAMPGIRPFTKFTYALNHQLGAGVAGFRALNLLVHLGAAVLAFLLVRALALGLRWSPAEAAWGALWVALVFAAHPVQTEAVTYISGRSSSLAGLCVLGSLVLWLQSWRLASLACFALALMARETAIVLPFALVLLAVTREQVRSTRWHWLMAGAGVAVVLLWPPYRYLLVTSLGIRPVWENLLAQANASGFMVGELWALHALNADPQLPVAVPLSMPVLLRLLLVASVAVAGILLLRRSRAWAIGLLWMFIWLAPTNSLLPRFEVANDRQWYIAMLGPVWLLACTGRVLAVRGAGLAKAMLGVVAVALVAVLLSATKMRNQVYMTETGFWRDVVSRNPGSARAASNLGYALALECRDAEAAEQFRRAVQLDPELVRAAVNLRLLQAGALVRDEDRRCRR